MTFEEYLKAGVDKGITAYRLAPVVMGTDGQVTFYIHPLGKDGITHDYLVKGNQLIRIQSALEGTPQPFEKEPSFIAHYDGVADGTTDVGDPGERGFTGHQGPQGVKGPTEAA